MGFVLSMVVSYLVGSISFSYLVAKKIAGIDIRTQGSGNAGATNTLRVLGKGPGILVLVLDVLKGLAAMLIAYLITGGDSLAYAFAGIFAIIGHNWPIFFSFRGGKGIATTVGVALGFSPTVFFIDAVITIIIIAATRYVSLGSLLFVTLLPILLLAFGKTTFAAVSLIIMLFAFLRHSQNIVNLVKGKERKLGDKSSRNLH